MINLIGFTIDLVSFIVAVLALPACTVIFWLSYDHKKKSNTDEENLNITDENNTKGKTL